MARFTSNKAGNDKPAVSSCQHGEVRSIRAEYDLAAALALNDDIAMVKLPPGHHVVDCMIDTDDLDSNGTPLIVLDAGILDGDTNAFIDGSTVGQAGGLARMDQVAGKRLAVNHTAEQLVGITVATGPATGATTGKVGMDVQYAAD